VDRPEGCAAGGEGRLCRRRPAHALRRRPLLVFLVDGGPWEGPVSWRKPTTFGISFGLTLITIAWVSSYLVMRPRTRAWLLGVFAADCVQIVKGTVLVRQGHPQLAYTTARYLKPLHASALHAVLVLPAVARVAPLLGRSERQRYRAVAVASGLYLVATVIALWLSMR
jgi:hypothetical protein